MAIFLSPWVELTPTCNGTWQDIDVSSYVNASATGLICLIRNTRNAGTQGNIGVRKKGSNGNPNWLFGDQTQVSVYPGLDANHKFQFYGPAAYNTLIKIYIIGYFMDDAVFSTPG